MTSSPKKYDDDDGRVICDMDVEGMRWHDKRARREQKVARRAMQGTLLTNSEARRFTWSAVLAGLVIVLVFSVTWVLFVLFLTEIVFK